MAKINLLKIKNDSSMQFRCFKISECQGEVEY